MTNNSEAQGSKLDPLKWVLVFVLVVVAVGANFFDSASVYLRWGAIIASGVVALFIAATTAKGKSVLVSLANSRTELRKVVWPTVAETNQTTVIVIIAVFIASIILYLMDSLFGWILKTIIG